MSGDPRRILRSFATLAGGEIATRLVALLVMARLGRVLGVEGFGALGFAAAVLVYFLLLADLGLELFATREVAAGQGERARALLETALGLRLLAALAGMLLLLPLATLLPVAPRERAVVILSGLSLVPLALTARWLFLGVERPAIVAWANTAGQVAFLAGTVAFVARPDDLPRVPPLQAVGELVTAGILLVAAWRWLGPFRPRLDLAAWRAVLPQSLPTLGGDFARTVVYSFDVILLGFLLPSAAVGHYVAATRLLLLVLTLGRFYYLAVLPSLVRALRGAGGRTAAPVLQLTARCAALLTAPVMTGGIILAGPLLAGLFGPDYDAAARTFQILAPTVMLVVVGGACRHALLASGHQRRDARNVAAGAALNIALNLLLIPTLGLPGAALATTIAEGAVLAWNWRAVARLIGPLALGPTLLVALGAAAVMTGVLVPLRAVPLWVNLPAGALAYTLVVLALDRQLLWQLRQFVPPRAPAIDAAPGGSE